MKKLFFCASVLAIAASCTNEMDTALLQPTQDVKGIAFTTGSEAISTRGIYEEVPNGDLFKYEPFWTAEKDQIEIFSTKTTSTSNATNVWNNMSAFNKTKVIYKATRSERDAYFTSTESKYLLDFAGATATAPAKFIAIYPNTIGNAKGFITNTTSGVTTETVTFNLPAIPAAQTQENQSGKGIYEYVAKYDVVNGYVKEDKKPGVGENIALSFERLNPVMVYKTKGLNAYQTEFGKLKTIKLESLGKVNDDGTLNSGVKSGLATAATDIDLTLTLKSDANGNLISDESTLTGTASAGSEITLTLGSASGLEWSDEAIAYMAMANSKRGKDYETMPKEEFAATYTFDNISIKVNRQISIPFEGPHFYNYPDLNVDDYPYLVFNNTKDYDGFAQSGEYTVLINSGTVDQIFDGNQVKLLDGNKIAATAVKKFIAKTDMSASDFTSLAKLTALEQVQLVNETEIPANAFAGQTSIVKLEMPNVTTIDKNFLGGTGNLNSLKYLNVASYEFKGNGDNATAKSVNQALFANKANMEYVDMTALADMTPVFGLPEAQISFKGCTNLKGVKVDNLKLRASSFEGCTALVKVEGSVNVSEGYAAFKDCNNTSFTSITLSNDVIAEDAFNGCTYLKSFIKDGAQVAPTKIGKNAFKGAQALQYMDLSKATEIGESAFENAKAFEATSATNDIVTVIVPYIEARTFVNTKIKKIEFTQATGFGNSFLAGNTEVVHIKFAKPFTVDTTFEWAGNLFGPNNCGSITLFYAEGQKYLSGRTLDLGTRTYTFMDVVKN